MTAAAQIIAFVTLAVLMILVVHQLELIADSLEWIKIYVQFPNG